MLDYNGFSYSPDYGFELYRDGHLLDSDEKVRAAACFARVFNRFNHNDKKTDFTGKYVLRCRKNFKAGSGNYCSLEKAQIKKLIRYMRTSFDIQITFTETDKDYVFNFTIEGKPIKHKFVLTFCRVFFEYPYNELAKDVFRIRDSGKIGDVDFTHKSFLEIYNLICATHADLWGGGHSLFLFPDLNMSIKVLKDSFETGASRVQDVYPGSEEVFEKIHRIRTGWNKNIDWEEKFDKRKRNYSANFKIIKKLKYEESIRRRARKALQ